MSSSADARARRSAREDRQRSADRERCRRPHRGMHALAAEARGDAGTTASTPRAALLRRPRACVAFVASARTRHTPRAAGPRAACRCRAAPSPTSSRSSSTSIKRGHGGKREHHESRAPPGQRGWAPESPSRRRPAAPRRAREPPPSARTAPPASAKSACPRVRRREPPSARSSLGAQLCTSRLAIVAHVDHDAMIIRSGDVRPNTRRDNPHRVHLCPRLWRRTPAQAHCSCFRAAQRASGRADANGVRAEARARRMPWLRGARFHDGGASKGRRRRQGQGQAASKPEGSAPGRSPIVFVSDASEPSAWATPCAALGTSLLTCRFDASSSRVAA